MRQEQSRYSCQVNLPDFGLEKQLLLKSSKMLVIGAGGLGCPAAQYLAAMGVGQLCIADDDVISITNLHRQILYREADVGQKKAAIACMVLRTQNPDTNVTWYDTRATAENIMDLIWQYDVILDCTDNFESRYIINDACVFAGKPVVYGAIYQYEGQVAVWNMKNAEGLRTPNYRDVYPEVNTAMVPNCADGGVFPTLAGIIGCMMANEAVKIVTNTGELLTSRMLVFDARYMQSRTIKLPEVTEHDIKRPPQAEEKLPSISQADLRQHLDGYQLIDVRTPEEHEAFNIGGLNIPMEHLDQLFDHLDGPKPLVIYCASGARSKEAVKTIRSLFQSEIYTLEGGLKDWE